MIDKGEPVVRLVVARKQLNYFNIEKQFELHSLQDIGDDDHTVMVLENLENSQLRFFRIEFKNKKQKETEVETSFLKLIQLGLLMNTVNDRDISPIVKSRSKVFRDE